MARSALLPYTFCVSALVGALLCACLPVTQVDSKKDVECEVNSDCMDFDPCTADRCTENKCYFDVDVGAPCSNLDPCSVDNSCDANGACTGGLAAPAGTACLDSNPCTVDDVCDDSGNCLAGAPIDLDSDPCLDCTCTENWGLECELVIGEPECACRLYGKIQYVDAFPDVTVKIVDAFADLEVQEVDAFADESGEWEIVDSFPDIKVKIVDAFPDYTIEYVDAFPGCD